MSNPPRLAQSRHARYHGEARRAETSSGRFGEVNLHFAEPGGAGEGGGGGDPGGNLRSFVPPPIRCVLSKVLEVHGLSSHSEQILNYYLITIFISHTGEEKHFCFVYV